jgi:PAS domain S-box-containing protein
MITDLTNSVQRIWRRLAGAWSHSSEERLELITKNITASIVVRNKAGQPTFWTPYTCVLTGLSEEELLELKEDPFEMLVVEEDRTRLTNALRICDLQEEIVTRFRIKHRSGLIVWVEARLVPICDKNGELESVMYSAVDVTDTMYRQRRIEEQSKNLEEFTYMVSHDLKSPIFTIRGMAEALAENENIKLDKDANQMINYLVEATDRLEKLTGSIVELSSTSNRRENPSKVSVRDVTDDVIKDLTAQLVATDGVINNGLNEQLVNGDRVRLYQVISNLLSNAIKYKHPDRSPMVELKGFRHGNFYTLTISDNGMGIPADKLDGIFRPFNRANADGTPGSGIGLACVKKIVDTMNGIVQVESTEGTGSTFWVHLPL